MNEAAAARRNPDLDGLRGIAALSVAISHCISQVTGLGLWDSSLRDFPSMPAAQVVMRVLSAFAPGDAAVMVFFVLSGHVLWQSFARKRMQLVRDLPDYVCARVYRLFPLAIASELPIGLLSAAPAAELVRNMLLLSSSMNHVLWSLQVEVEASLLLFVLWGLTKGRTWGMAVAFLATAVAVPFGRGDPFVVFLPAFVLGAFIGSVPAAVWRNRWLLVSGIVILVFTNVVLGHGGVTRCFEIMGATILVGGVSHGRLPALHWRVPLFLGAISYPFYLTHTVGLAFTDTWLRGATYPSPYVSIATRAVVSVALTIPLAWLLHVLVELPAQRARPRIAWPFTLDWSVPRPPLLRRPLRADVPAVALNEPDRRIIKDS